MSNFVCERERGRMTIEDQTCLAYRGWVLRLVTAPAPACYRLMLPHQTRPPQQKRGIIPQQHVIQNSLWAFTLQIFQYTFQQNEDDDANDCDQKSKYKAV